MVNLDPKVWGPKFWFVFHTITLNYPNNPNSVTKKKYYDFVQNIPMFLPVEEIATHFSKLLNEFPIQPYLDNRESFIKWFWFIHNKINEKLEKPIISLKEFYIQYYEQYKSTNVKLIEYYKIRQKIIYTVLILLLCGIIYYLYDK
jgi:hypothetical protein